MIARAAVIAAIACLLLLRSEVLPIRSYTMADGLAADQIDNIVADSRGFVWFCTPGGLSRFDGFRIANFSLAEGLAHRGAQAFLETRSGAYFVGTARGLCQFRTGTGRNQFLTYLPGNRPIENDVTALLESSTGRIWCGTMGGLFEFVNGREFRRQQLPPPPPGWKGVEISQIAEDGCGKLWLATTSGLYAIGKDGAVQWLTKKNGLPSDYVSALLADKPDALWAGSRGGLTMIRDGCVTGEPRVQRVYPPDVGRNVVALAKGTDGVLWLGTETGIMRLLPGGRTQHLTRAQGLTDRVMYSLASDKFGNIWAGTEAAGVMNIQPEGFTKFREQDGLDSDRVWSVLGDRAGDVLAVTASQSQTTWLLNIFDGARFHSMAAPKVFAKSRTWGNHRILLQSRTGEWWAATKRGLCRYPRGNAASLADRPPAACYFPDRDVFQIFEDSKGGIWAAAQSSEGDRLMRWDPKRRAVVTFEEFPRAPALVKSFAEDRRGNIWMGLWTPGGLYRYDGRQFTRFGSNDGLPGGTVFALLIDRLGRLWIGAGGGLGLVEDPGSVALKVRVYHQSDGLSSDVVRALVDDQDGNIYAGTPAGVDRLDPTTGHVKHFSVADGFARGQIQSAFRDGAGNLWFATSLGLSRLVPTAPRPLLNPTVVITGLQTGGEPFPVSQSGDTSISHIELEPSRNQFQVEFVAFTGEPEANLKYSYKLEGTDSDWSPPRRDHLINYAALAAGRYRFLVKAMNSGGLESLTPAEVSFTVLPPFWRRWWFEGLALLALATVVYLLHSYRVSHIVNLERMRTTIATDLHDDIGATLSQIAILSEVARAGVSREDRRAQESLHRVASLARELVDSMSDIVWSIQTEPKGLDSLVRRMREFALDLLANQGIEFDLRASFPRDNARLSLQAKRQLFLMFKESIHNVSRHSGCTVVMAELKVEFREITLIVEDNGRGWAARERPPGSTGGNGIPGMRQRAENLGGSFELVSNPGRGCRVSIRVPLRRTAFSKEPV